MKLSDKIQVPELDELRVARLERAIVAELANTTPAVRNTRKSLAWKGAIAMVAVAGVALAIGLNLRAAHAPATASAPTRLEATEVLTGAGQSSRLTLGDAVVDVGSDTSLSVQRFSDGRIVLQLQAGLVHCEVEPRVNRPTFQVASGDVMVTVIGTGFDVERGDTVEVRVQHGIVGVQTSHESVHLRAGEEWQGSPHADRSLALLLRDRDQAQQHATETDLAAPTPGRKPATGHGHSSKQSTGVADAGTTRSKTPAIEPLPPAVKLSKVLEGANPLPPIFKKSQAPALARLEEISAKNPRAAVKELEALAATSTGSDASFAMYSRAYLLFFKLHDNEAAITTATQYARRFPKGIEAEDMLWLRVRASCETSRTSTCRAAAHTYLRNYPNGVFQGLCSRIITTTGTD